jgi:FkbM family methyltransferase
MLTVTELAKPLLRRWPFHAGKGRLASRFNTEDIPAGSLTRMKSGVLLRLRCDPMYTSPYLYGEYEVQHTKVVQTIVGPGDVCLDVGANFGYYSALLSQLAGPTGRVYGFEPLPHFYVLALETIELNQASEVVKLHNVGLGSAPGILNVYTFSGLPQGHASSCHLNRPDATPHQCSVTTLDRFVVENAMDRVDFMKVDVEGDELNVFLGAERLLSASSAPAITFEVNIDCVAARGLRPDDVQALLVRYGYSSFFQIPHKGRPGKVSALLKRSSDYLALKDSHLRQLNKLKASFDLV